MLPYFEICPFLDTSFLQKFRAEKAAVSWVSVQNSPDTLVPPTIKAHKITAHPRFFKQKKEHKKQMPIQIF